MRTLLAGMAVAGTLALAAPAQAAPTSFWFDCVGPTPLQTTVSTGQTWSPTAPAKSYQEGAGCGWLDTGLKGATQPNRFYDAAFGGAYGGEVRKLDITLYAPYNDTATTKSIDLIIRADGEEVANLTQVVPTVGAPSSASVAPFTYTVSGVDLPALAGTRTREFELSVAQSFIDDTPGWLLGAKEVPSNVKFYAFDDLTQEEKDEILGVEAEEAIAGF